MFDEMPMRASGGRGREIVEEFVLLLLVLLSSVVLESELRILKDGFAPEGGGNDGCVTRFLPSLYEPLKRKVSLCRAGRRLRQSSEKLKIKNVLPCCHEMIWAHLLRGFFKKLKVICRSGSTYDRTGSFPV